ncbi:MAG: methyltransferase family protein [Promethearchaeota archaeon]
MPEEEAISANYSWKRDPLFWTYSILMFLPILMVFFFYNYFNLIFFVYAGVVLFVCSFALIWRAGGEFRKRGGAPEGESIVHTTVLVDSGVYGVVRHPQYLGFMLIVLSFVLMSQHWLSVFAGVGGCVLFYIDVRREEQSNIAKFGDEYRRYMQEVPGLNILIGVFRLLRRRRIQP